MYDTISDTKTKIPCCSGWWGRDNIQPLSWTVPYSQYWGQHLIPKVNLPSSKTFQSSRLQEKTFPPLLKTDNNFKSEFTLLASPSSWQTSQPRKFWLLASVAEGTPLCGDRRRSRKAFRPLEEMQLYDKDSTRGQSQWRDLAVLFITLL